MPKPPKPSRKHHFVTQAQLRHFARNPDQRQIWVFDKSTDRAWISSIRDAGSENDFNTVELDTGRWNFEDLFQDIDDLSAQLIANIVERNSVSWFDQQDRKALHDLFATQILRTSFARTTPRHLVQHMREMVQVFGYDPDDDPAMSMPTDAALRLGAVQSFLERDEMARSLERLVPALFAAGPDQYFVLSDDPIVITNAFPYGDNGLKSHGVIVFLPITPVLAIALLCPTIISRYEAIAQLEPNPPERQRMERYRDGLRSGNPIEIMPSELDGWNERQVARSARYLYASADNFDFARRILNDHPKLRRVETHITVGGLGQGLPRRSGMPEGLQLVVQGRFDHCMIPLLEVDDTGGDICGRTESTELLRQVAADPNDIRATLYDDRQPRREISKAMIERFGEPAEGWFRVVHRDASLKALMEQIDARKKNRD